MSTDFQYLFSVNEVVSLLRNNGGQFAPERGGQFDPEYGGQFAADLGGQYHRNFQ